MTAFEVVEATLTQAMKLARRHKGALSIISIVNGLRSRFSSPPPPSSPPPQLSSSPQTAAAVTRATSTQDHCYELSRNKKQWHLDDYDKRICSGFSLDTSLQLSKQLIRLSCCSAPQYMDVKCTCIVTSVCSVTVAGCSEKRDLLVVRGFKNAMHVLAPFAAAIQPYTVIEIDTIAGACNVCFLKEDCDEWSWITAVEIAAFTTAAALNAEAFEETAPEADLMSTLKVAGEAPNEMSLYESWVRGGGEDDEEGARSSSDSDSEGEFPRTIPKPDLPPPNFQPMQPFEVPEAEGYVYHCSSETYDECKSRKLFGGFKNFPRLRIGCVLFLTNNSKKEVMGVFRATSACGRFSNDAWYDKAKGASRYPWQVRIERAGGEICTISSKEFRRLTDSVKGDVLTAAHVRNVVEGFKLEGWKDAGAAAREEKIKIKREHETKRDIEWDRLKAKELRRVARHAAAKREKKKKKKKQEAKRKGKRVGGGELGSLEQALFNEPGLLRLDVGSGSVLKLIFSLVGRDFDFCRAAVRVVTEGLDKGRSELLEFSDVIEKGSGVKAVLTQLLCTAVGGADGYTKTIYDGDRVKEGTTGAEMGAFLLTPASATKEAEFARGPSSPTRVQAYQGLHHSQFADEHPASAVYRGTEFSQTMANMVGEIFKARKGCFGNVAELPGDKLKRLLKDLLMQYVYVTCAIPDSTPLTDNDTVFVCFEGDRMHRIVKNLVTTGRGPILSGLELKGKATEELCELLCRHIKVISRKVRSHCEGVREVHMSDSSLNLYLIEGEEETHVVYGGGDREEVCAIWKSHYAMLAKAYDALGNNPELKLCRIFVMLKTYDILDARGGYQASITPAVVDCLQSEFKVSHECFASPLNRSFKSFGSLFVSRDCYFGSKGNFFTMQETEGSFEINPTFDPVTIRRVLSKIMSMMNENEKKGGGSLSFILIVPRFGDMYKFLKGGGDDLVGIEDKVRAIREVNKANFLMGMQHNARKFVEGENWKAIVPTLVVVLQNEKGFREWGVGMWEKLDKLEAAFQERQLDDVRNLKSSVGVEGTGEVEGGFDADILMMLGGSEEALGEQILKVLKMRESRGSGWTKTSELLSIFARVFGRRERRKKKDDASWFGNQWCAVPKEDGGKFYNHPELDFAFEEQPEDFGEFIEDYFNRTLRKEVEELGSEGRAEWGMQGEDSVWKTRLQRYNQTN